MILTGGMVDRSMRRADRGSLLFFSWISLTASLATRAWSGSTQLIVASASCSAQSSFCQPGPRCHCILELRRNSDCFSTRAVEGRRYRSTKCAIFAPKLHFQRATAYIEEDGTFQSRSLRFTNKRKYRVAISVVTSPCFLVHLLSGLPDLAQARRKQCGFAASETRSYSATS